MCDFFMGKLDTCRKSPNVLEVEMFAISSSDYQLFKVKTGLWLRAEAHSLSDCLQASLYVHEKLGAIKGIL